MALELKKYYEIQNAKYGTVINLSGNHSGNVIPSGNSVTLYSRTNDPDQKWAAFAYENAAKVCSQRNAAYVLNYNTTDASCIVWPISTTSVTDSEIDYMTVDRDQNLYRLKLSRRNLFLTATGATGKLYWRAPTNDDTQLFKLIDTEVPPVVGGDSSLVDKYLQAHLNNYTPNRAAEGGAISEITIHHCAGNMNIESLGALWQNPTRKGSSHYGVSGEKIGQYVRESDVAWTNSLWEANCRAVTIETSNSGGAPDWPVSSTSFDKLVALVADIAQRNNLGKLVKGSNLTWHSMYTATACPGPYLFSKLQELVDRANTINGY